MSTAAIVDMKTHRIYLIDTSSSKQPIEIIKVDEVIVRYNKNSERYLKNQP
jgi:hypothetical protein